MLKIELKERNLRVFWEKKEEVEAIVVTKEESNPSLISDIYDGLRESLKKGICFDMILCNKSTFMKTLKEASGTSWRWEDFKREMLLDSFEQKPPKNMKLFGYMFGVNEESETIEDGDFIFLKDCKQVSILINGELKSIAHCTIKKATYNPIETKGG